MTQTTNISSNRLIKSNSAFENRILKELAKRKENNLARDLKDIFSVDPVHVVIDNKFYLNFATNDYLGLSQHQYVKKRAIEYTKEYGVGSPSSRLIAGNSALAARIERKLAEYKGTEAALLFSSGYQLNSTLIPLLTKESKHILLDRLCHNSLLTGLEHKFRNGICTRFKHNDLQDLGQKLKQRNKSQDDEAWIVTESIFGMDGDCADLEELETIREKQSACLYVDEAHATGVAGDYGFGLVESKSENVIVMGTLGKGAGSFGAYVACSQPVKDYIINYASGFIYSTALPPPVLGAIDAAVDLIPEMFKERILLLTRSQELRNQLSKLGFEYGNSNSQIIPIILGDSDAVLSLSTHLQSNGIYAPAIRYPTVPEGLARVRISLSAVHNKQHLSRLRNALSTWRPSSK